MGLNTWTGWIETAFSKRSRRRPLMKGSGQRRLPPSKTLVYGVAVAFYSIGVLAVLEIAHMLLFHQVQPEALNAIVFLSGLVLGAFFTNTQS